MTLWDTIKQNIFAGESGGDYNALFGYSNRPGGAFEGKPITQMTVDEALQFANPSGQYGQWVKGQIGRVATPMGAYQVVGTTLRDAKRGLGLTGSEKMTPELQDRIGQWIYQTQGTGAWEGYKPNAAAQSVASDTMTSLGLKPQQTEARQMAGLLGDTPQQQAPQKKSFWDNIGFLSYPDKRARLAMALEGMTMNPNQALIQSLGQGIQTRAGERKTAEVQNRTITALQKLGTPQAQRALEYMQAGGDAATALKIAFETQDSRGVVVGGNVVDPVTGRVIYQAPEKEAAPNIPAAFLTLDMQARAGGLVPEAEGGDGGYEQFMRTRGAGLAEQAKQEAKTGVEQRAAAPADIAAADDALSLIDSIRNDPARKAATGMSSVLNAIPGTQGYDFNQKVEQLKSGAFMTAIQQLRGMGALSNAEGQTATRAVTRLNTAMTEEGFLEALAEYEAIVKKGRERAAATIGQQQTPVTAPQSGGMSDDDLIKLYGGQ